MTAKTYWGKIFSEALADLMNEKINVEEFEKRIAGAELEPEIFSSIVWMVLQLSKKIACLEEELRKLRSAVFTIVKEI